MYSEKGKLNFALLLCLSFTRGLGKMEPYVIGGDYTDIVHFPHSVFLNIDCDSSSWICGSSILNQKILLTAAHCLAGCRKHWHIEGYAGHEDLSQVKVVRTVDKFIKHERYNDRSMSNDIALMSLARSLPLGRYIKRVIIKRTHSFKELASVAGWGIVNRATNKDTIVLKSAVQRLIKASRCAEFGFLASGMMCAVSPETNTSPASGDSGSALVTRGLQQIGLVSFIFSEHPDTPIYTNVSYFYNWINKKSRMLHCN